MLLEGKANIHWPYKRWTIIGHAPLDNNTLGLSLVDCQTEASQTLAYASPFPLWFPLPYTGEMERHHVSQPSAEIQPTLVKIDMLHTDIYSPIWSISHMPY